MPWACRLVSVGLWSGRFEDGVPKNSPKIANPSSVAIVLLSENCVWTEPEIVESQRLPTGLIGLAGGTAVLRTDSGAELVVVGPSEMNLISAERARVHHGEVVVRVTEGGEGFALITPTSEVIDLGTEFAVKVDSHGDTEVHVFDGSVSHRKLQQAPEQSQFCTPAWQSPAMSMDNRQARCR